MTDKLIVNVALTGNVHHKTDNPNLPVTPEEVTADARRCVDEGATVFHLHARDERGNPTSHPARFKLYIDAVRDSVPEAIICASCSGRHSQEFNERAGVLDLDGIDLASLTVGSYNTFTGVSVNAPPTVKALAYRMKDRGIKPELECFELGHVHYLHRLLDKGHIDAPLYVNLFLGNPWTIPATWEYLNLMVGALPERAVWSAAGIGRFQLDVIQWAIEMGGHVRTGLEDNLYVYVKGKRFPAFNPSKVGTSVSVARVMGREPATPQEAREILGLA